jgi:hypothetical protein
LQRIEDEKMRIRRERKEVAETISRILNLPPQPAKTSGKGQKGKAKGRGSEQRPAERQRQNMSSSSRMHSRPNEVQASERAAQRKMKWRAIKAKRRAQSAKPEPGAFEYGAP